MKAKADSWKREPFVGGVPVPYRASFTSSEFERLSGGLIPKQMEDKWFIYYEEPYLFLHRSWTGQPVFRVKLRASHTGADVEEALVSWPQDPDVEYEARLLDFLIANLLLGYSKPFPQPAGAKESIPGVLQHHISGTGYPESSAGRMRSPSIVHGDITTMEVDAIVNAANEWMLGGGGVDGAIHSAAGPGLLEACRAIPEVRPGIRCPVGEARITPGFRLPAKHVIHTVGPRWHGGGRNEPELLASCYRACFALAHEHQLRSIAFPAISTGAFAYPLLPACRIAVAECSAFLERETSVSEIILVGFAKQDVAALRKALSELQ